MPLSRTAFIVLLCLLMLMSGCTRKSIKRDADDLGCVACVLWNRYASFSIRADSLDKSGRIHFQYSKHVHNLRIDVSKDRYLAFSVVHIPGAGYFYKNVSDQVGCRPDVYEQLVLQADIILFMLSRAYPDGPGPGMRTGSFSLKSHPRQDGHEFAVATGTVSERVLTLTHPWSASGKMMPFQDSSLSYEMLVDSDIMLGSIAFGQPITGEWSADADVTVIPEDEPLSQWRLCYTGSYDYDEATGKRIHVPDLADTAGFRTFGDVLGAVREARFSRHRR